MPSNKHKIPRSEAKKFAKEFDRKKAEGKETLKDIPDGFLFTADEVKELLSNPRAVSFVIRFGWKKTQMGNGTEKDTICPILMVLDDKNKIIEGSSDAATDDAMAMSARDAGEPGGGFLDEGDPIPPPPLDLDN
jgi:hypothetical protein